MEGAWSKAAGEGAGASPASLPHGHNILLCVCLCSIKGPSDGEILLALCTHEGAGHCSLFLWGAQDCLSVLSVLPAHRITLQHRLQL